MNKDTSAPVGGTVQLQGSKSGDSQLPITPAPEYPMSLPGFAGIFSHMGIPIHRYAYIQN